MRDTLFLAGPDVSELLTIDDCIAAVEEAFRAHGEKRVSRPGLLSVHEDAGAFHIKTAAVVLGESRYFGAKTNANFPGNPSRHGLPTIQGVMLLFDANDGCPLAIMDSIELTVLRTGAATAVAAKHLARRDARSVAIAGCGRQGRVQLEALSRVLPIERAAVFDENEEIAQRFVSEMSAKIGIDVRIAGDLESMRESDVWITCTPSRHPFLGIEHVRDGAFVAAVGADNPEKAEIHPELMRAARVFSDLTAQTATIGDLRYAIAAGVVTREHVRGELGEVVAGTKRGRESDEEIVLFDSTGAGFQDTAAAAIVYERALAGGRGTRLSFGR